jgi:hypothetical protein
MKSSYEVGRDILGPILYRFCYQLWLHQLAWHDREAIALFVSRGGIRLRYFFNEFLAVTGQEPPLPMSDYYVSRMAALKTNMALRPQDAVDELAKEFRYWTVHDSMGALLPWPVFEPWWNALGEDLQRKYSAEHINRDILLALLSPEHRGHQVLQAYFSDQADLSRRHLDSARGGRQHVLLVDTGWSGSILGAIQAVYPDVSFMGHFFGRYAYGEAWKPWFGQLIGIEVEDRTFRWHRPHTSLFQHRHLIEGMCEPAWPSVEWYRADESGQVFSQAGPIPPERIQPSAEEPFAQGVADYIRGNQAGLSAHAIHRKADAAARRLRRLICFPRAAESELLTVKTRSADFGKNLDVPVLLATGKTTTLRERIANVRRSLWPEAQIALEFGVWRIPIQLAHLLANRRLMRLAAWLDKRLA